MTKFVRVMDKDISNASGRKFKIGEVNVSDEWDPNATTLDTIKGINFSTEESIIRWIRRGDTLVFFVDTDYYDMEDISEVMESVKEAFPTTKVLMLPDDMIDDIKIFREDDPLVAVEMKVANNEINKNLSKIDWANVELGGLNVGEMGL